MAFALVVAARLQGQCNVLSLPSYAIGRQGGRGGHAGVDPVADRPRVPRHDYLRRAIVFHLG